MKQYISMYIDNELSLDEKSEFIRQIHSDKEFMEDAIAFLRQEKMLAAALSREVPAMVAPSPKIKIFPSFRQAAGLAAAACLLIGLTFLFIRNSSLTVAPILENETVRHRFVIYQTDSSTMEITGSFTDWQRIPMRRVGAKGYWEISLDLPPGDHRYSFIHNNTEFLPDPTVAAREKDDFGSVNSILSVET